MELAHSVTDALNLVFLWQNCRPEMVCAICLTKTVAWYYDDTSVLQHLLAVQPLACLTNLLGLLESTLRQLNSGECIQGSINGGAAHTFQLIQDLSKSSCLRIQRRSTADLCSAQGRLQPPGVDCNTPGQSAATREATYSSIHGCHKVRQCIKVGESMLLH